MDRKLHRQTGSRCLRDQGWKLNESGELFDMKDAPFTEKPVPDDSTDPTAAAARKRLQSILDTLNPKAGKTEPLPKAGAKAPAE